MFYTRSSIPKKYFEMRKNDKEAPEPFVVCETCDRKVHTICAMHAGIDMYICAHCQKGNERTHSAKKLPHSSLSNHIQKSINRYMQEIGLHTNMNEVFVRNVLVEDKNVPVEEELRKFFLQNELVTEYEYRYRALFAFQRTERGEVCFFALYSQEYTKRGQVYLSYLDSVKYFEPKEHRSGIYMEILLSYMDYARTQGYTSFHLWACPPQSGMDYIFFRHLANQRYQSKARLIRWYTGIFEEAVKRGIAVKFQNMYEQITSNSIGELALKQIPMFHGDFWPDAIRICCSGAKQNHLSVIPKLNMLLKKFKDAFFYVNLDSKAPNLTLRDAVHTCDVVQDRFSLTLSK